MRLTVPLFFILLCFSCVSGHLTSDLSNGQAFRLYRHSLDQESDLKAVYNADSSHVLVIQPGDIMQGDPCSFVVIDLTDRSVVIQSINKYRDAEWHNNHTLKLKKNIGYVRPATDPGQPVKEKSYELFDINTKELSENPHTNPEKF